MVERPSVVSGRVVTPVDTSERPMPGLMVTLHRVGPDSAGPVDSVVTDAAGRYSITYSRFGDENAVYFAAAVYRGIAYFSAPLQGVRSVGGDAEITVFDTTSHRVTLHVRGHHVVMTSPHPDGNRDIVEVWELSNDTTVTVVGRDSLTAVWSARLPEHATHFVVGPGDVAQSSLAVRKDSVLLLAAFGPGVKQLSYSYSLAPGEFPYSLAITAPTGVLEVLVEEVAAQVTGNQLKPVDAATTQGHTFKRWLGQDLQPGAVVRVTVPTTTAALRTRILLSLVALIVLAMVVALIRALKRRVAVPAAPESPMERRDVLLASIASLDARQARPDQALSPDEYTAQRAALKSDLSALLAAEGEAT